MNLYRIYRLPRCRSDSVYAMLTLKSRGRFPGRTKWVVSEFGCLQCVICIYSQKKYISILSVNLAFIVQTLFSLKLDGVVYQLSEILILITKTRPGFCNISLLFSFYSPRERFPFESSVIEINAPFI